MGPLTSCRPSTISATACDTVEAGYQCKDNISHSWGQYSPYFTVPSTISDVVPGDCQVTFAQILARHGARFPTASKTAQYNATIQQLHQNVKSYKGKYAFLQDYVYSLGADDLTLFGQQQMINAGTKFYGRYRDLTRSQTPFFRSASEARVLESAQNFTQGFHNAKSRDPAARGGDSFPYSMVVIQEGNGENNTLSHDLCTAFENGPDSKIGSSAHSTWANTFIPPIMTRLNHDLPGANLTIAQTINIMDLCPFSTVASNTGAGSAFCNLFTASEWQQYGYYQSLGKWYGYGRGNPLGSTQGVGFTNELIARMTNEPVVDATSTNHTLDSNPATFPLEASHTLFADFSHDNDLSGHFAALGLYNATAHLSNTRLENEVQTHGFSAAWTVPFAARAYFEKMQCAGQSEELVRVLVNDRVVPLQNCGADALGRCRLSAWIESLSFARDNGLWDQCFV